MDTLVRYALIRDLMPCLFFMLFMPALRCFIIYWTYYMVPDNVAEYGRASMAWYSGIVLRIANEPSRSYLTRTYQVFLVYQFSAVTLLLCSSIFHAMHCLGATVYTWYARLDYAGENFCFRYLRHNDEKTEDTAMQLTDVYSQVICALSHCRNRCYDQWLYVCSILLSIPRLPFVLDVLLPSRDPLLCLWNCCHYIPSSVWEARLCRH